MPGLPDDVPASPDTGTNADREPRRIALFEDRYGAGSHEQLLALLRQPCIPFARVAEQFGVTRERVRQWHGQLLPGAPSGHERKRQCALLRQRRRLLEDPLFKDFYRHARERFPADRIGLIRTRTRYRSRRLLLDGLAIALCRGTMETHGIRLGPTSARTFDAIDFVYVRLEAENEYLVIPRPLVRAPLIPDSALVGPFRNSFDALTAVTETSAPGTA